MNSQTGHVLVFDSGVGGLSIVQHIREALPRVQLTYLADPEYFPYGTLNDEELQQRVLTLLSNVSEQLSPDIIVLACNSASTLALPHLRAHLSLPIVGVVPAIKPAAQCSQSKVIGLLATPATVNRRYTDDLIAEFAPECDVLRLGSSELVELVEKELWGQPQPAKAFEQALAPLLTDPRWHQLDTVVLACTHFPLVRDKLSAAAPSVTHWVDSGAAIARRVQHVLTEVCAGTSPAPAVADRALLTGSTQASEALSNTFREFGFVHIDLI